MKTFSELMELMETIDQIDEAFTDRKDQAMAKDAIKDLTIIKNAIDSSIKDLKSGNVSSNFATLTKHMSDTTSASWYRHFFK